MYVQQKRKFKFKYSRQKVEYKKKIPAQACFEMVNTKRIIWKERDTIIAAKWLNHFSLFLLRHFSLVLFLSKLTSWLWCASIRIALKLSMVNTNVLDTTRGTYKTMIIFTNAAIVKAVLRNLNITNFMSKWAIPMKKKIFKCKYPDCDVTFVLKQNRTIHYVDFHNQLTRKKRKNCARLIWRFSILNWNNFRASFVMLVFFNADWLDSSQQKKKHKVKIWLKRMRPNDKNEAESDQKPKKSKREPKSDQERNAPREKIYACTYDGCDKIYGRLNCLVRHYKTHDKVWVCRFCCEVFKTFFERAVHHKIHINKEQYQRRKEREREMHLLSIHNASNVMWRNLNGETSSLI